MKHCEKTLRSRKAKISRKAKRNYNKRGKMIGGLDPNFAEIGMNYEIGEIPGTIRMNPTYDELVKIIDNVRMNPTYDELVKIIDNVVDTADIDLYYSLEKYLRAIIFYHNKIQEYEDYVELISMTRVGYLAITKYIEKFNAWHRVDGWYWKISQLHDQIGDLETTIHNIDTAQEAAQEDIIDGFVQVD